MSCKLVVSCFPASLNQTYRPSLPENLFVPLCYSKRIIGRQTWATESLGRVEPPLNTYFHISRQTGKTSPGGVELQGTAQLCHPALCFLYGNNDNWFFRFMQAAVESNCSRAAVSRVYSRIPCYQRRTTLQPPASQKAFELDSNRSRPAVTLRQFKINLPFAGSVALHLNVVALFPPRIRTKKFEKFVQFVAKFPYCEGHRDLLWRCRRINQHKICTLTT
jgi:hypothetical protein